MPNLVPSIDAPLVIPTTTPSGVSPIKWGGAPSFNRFTNDFDVTPTGQIVMLNDVGAFIQWLWKALITARNKYRIYTYKGKASFGSDFPPLIGQPYNDLVMQSVATRFCREAIEFDSRIRVINYINVQINADTMLISVAVTMVTGREVQFQQMWNIR